MVALVLTVGLSAFILLRRPPPSLPVHTIADLPPAPVTIRAAPKAIQKVVAQLGEDFDGKAGIAVADVSNHWIAGYHAGDPMPQQSVSKLWVAITLLDAVDPVAPEDPRGAVADRLQRRLGQCRLLARDHDALGGWLLGVV